jgi:hypothetical protein
MRTEITVLKVEPEVSEKDEGQERMRDEDDLSSVFRVLG